MAEAVVAKMCPNEQVADLVLWKDPKQSGGVFAGCTVAYYFLGASGYTVMSLLSNAALFVVVVSFLWANLATLVGRGQPPIPDIQISEATARDLAAKVVGFTNSKLKFAHAVATGQNIMLSVKSAFCLYLTAKVGNWFSFLTLVYTAVFFSFTFPKVYVLKQKEIDEFAGVAMEHIKTYYNTIEQAILAKIPKAKEN